ncbi:hypothetical protein LJK88_00935 [Paenibacillus sp. P26]|nr:hypothetical protein LJK88_00935 [Paenibacillus sp. P26]
MLKELGFLLPKKAGGAKKVKKRLRLQASLRIGISVMAIMMSAAPVLPSQTHAEIVYTKSDQSTTVRAPEGHPFVSGKHMVWIDSDEQGRQSRCFTAAWTAVRPSNSQALPL